jgi:hypothetical protein
MDELELTKLFAMLTLKGCPAKEAIVLMCYAYKDKRDLVGVELIKTCIEIEQTLKSYLIKDPIIIQ